ncbi:MAG: hypothetical protein PWP08_1464 [Methanofollis sp.]|nr:hypothetical protein [Methanofollis sp.]
MPKCQKISVHMRVRKHLQRVGSAYAVAAVLDDRIAGATTEDEKIWRVAASGAEVRE